MRKNPQGIHKRCASMFIALKHSGTCHAVRQLLNGYSSDTIAMLCSTCKIAPTDMDAFLYADSKLSVHQLTSIMSNLNYRCVFQKEETGELGQVSPERLVEHIRVMQELNILNNMRANKAEDEATQSDSTTD